VLDVVVLAVVAVVAVLVLALVFVAAVAAAVDVVPTGTLVAAARDVAAAAPSPNAAVESVTVVISAAGAAAATPDAVMANGSGETAIQNPPNVNAVRAVAAQRAGALFRLVFRRVCGDRATRTTGNSGTAGDELMRARAILVSCVGIISSLPFVGRVSRAGIKRRPSLD
jgi:hypothetical protein